MVVTYIIMQKCEMSCACLFCIMFIEDWKNYTTLHQLSNPLHAIADVSRLGIGFPTLKHVEAGIRVLEIWDFVMTGSAGFLN